MRKDIALSFPIFKKREKLCRYLFRLCVDKKSYRGLNSSTIIAKNKAQTFENA